MPKPIREVENMTLSEIRERLGAVEQLRAENRELRRQLSQIARILKQAEK